MTRYFLRNPIAQTNLFLEYGWLLADYKEMKYETETTLERLNSDEAKLLDGLDNHGSLADDGLEILKSLGSYYKSKDTVAKQRIVSSIYPEKLIFDKSGYRTPKL